MDFSIDDIDKILPKELTEQKKGRLKEGLGQFYQRNCQNDKYYTEFYLKTSNSFFLQGDLIKELRFPIFNKETRKYEKLYFDAILISNTCDVDEANANNRNIPKKVILAKLIPLNAFVDSLTELEIESAANILTLIKNQQYSNVIYFPPTNEGIDYIAYLDDFSILDVDELNLLKEDIDENRIESLDYFGHYLFIFKLSYHFCRLPEETQR